MFKGLKKAIHISEGAMHLFRHQHDSRVRKGKDRVMGLERLDVSMLCQHEHVYSYVESSIRVYLQWFKDEVMYVKRQLC